MQLDFGKLRLPQPLMRGVMCLTKPINISWPLLLLLCILVSACTTPKNQTKESDPKRQRPGSAEEWQKVSAVEWTAFAEAWLSELHGTNSDSNSDVNGQVVFMNITAAPEQQWGFILLTLSLSDTDEELAAIAAGPMEHLLGKHGERYISLYEKQAAIDSKFLHALSGVWRNTMQEDVWLRIEKLIDQVPVPINENTQDIAHEKRIQMEEWQLERLQDELRRRKKTGE